MHFLKKIPIQSLASLFSFLLCQWLIRLEFFYRKCLRLTSWSYVWKRDESWSADQSNAFILFSSKRSGLAFFFSFTEECQVSLNMLGPCLSSWSVSCGRANAYVPQHAFKCSSNKIMTASRRSQHPWNSFNSWSRRESRRASVIILFELDNWLSLSLDQRVKQSSRAWENEDEPTLERKD